MVTMEPLRGLAVGDDPHDSWSAAGLSRGGLGRFVRTAQAVVGLTGEVDVLLADDRTLRRLNREFRGKDKATDVLSFPAVEEFATEHAGDLAISLETAARQAREHGHSLRDEVRVLLLHGLLHLSGMDHETDRGEMAAKETELRKRLRLPSGLIARVEGVSDGREKSRSPAGMTTRKARATAEATATTKAKAKTKATAKTKTKATAKTKTKATAKTTATAKAKAGSLRDSSREMRVASKDGTAAKKRGRR